MQTIEGLGKVYRAERCLLVEAQFDPRSSTLTYLVWDAATKDAVVVDPVLDFDANRGAVSDAPIEKLASSIAGKGLHVHWILETHIHADHFSGGDRLRQRIGAPIAVSSGIRQVDAFFGPMFGLEPAPMAFDRLVSDGESLAAGSLAIDVIATPGHTPACVTYGIGGALFTGDTLFMPDYGTGRCDFPGGSAAALWSSVQGLYRRFPDDTPVYVGHDYQPDGRALAYQTTIGAQKAGNKQLNASTTLDCFAAWRTERDGTLPLPQLLFQALQVNLRAGRLPEPIDGVRHLKIPLGQFG